MATVRACTAQFISHHMSHHIRGGMLSSALNNHMMRHSAAGIRSNAFVCVRGIATVRLNQSPSSATRPLTTASQRALSPRLNFRGLYTSVPCMQKPAIKPIDLDSMSSAEASRRLSEMNDWKPTKAFNIKQMWGDRNNRISIYRIGFSFVAMGLMLYIISAELGRAGESVRKKEYASIYTHDRTSSVADSLSKTKISDAARAKDAERESAK
eukprot:Opistho-2@45458